MLVQISLLLGQQINISEFDSLKVLNIPYLSPRRVKIYNHLVHWMYLVSLFLDKDAWFIVTTILISFAKSVTIGFLLIFYVEPS